MPPELNWSSLEAPVVLDVVETEPFHLAALDDTERPIFPGLSIGHCITGETGSLGAIVRALDNAELHVLSAGHVLAAAGRASIGDDIIQPGGLDGGECPGQTIGVLADFVKLQAGPGFPNLADAALARLDPAIVIDPGSRPISRLAMREEIGVHDVLFRIGCRTGDTFVLMKIPASRRPWSSPFLAEAAPASAFGI